MFPKSVPKPSAHNHIDSLIGAEVLIVGTVTFSGCLRLEGRITGGVRARQDDSSVLVIGNEGHLEGEVQAPHVKVSGKVDGPIQASQSLEVYPNGRIKGDIEYARLEVHEGAQLQGALRMYVPSLIAVNNDVIRIVESA
jgi:cytoskeletal protein CcmA (bactofilin family)